MAENNDARNFERYCKAAMAGIAVLLAVVFLAGIASWCKTGCFSAFLYVCTIYILAAAVMPTFAIIVAIPSAVAGAIGAAVGRSGHASAYGAMIFACISGEYIWFGGWNGKTSSIDVDSWFLVFASAVGALAGGAGAVIGRTVPAAGEDVRPLRLSLSESVVGAILAAILATYIFWIV